jgi:hypothetical protein
LIVKPEQFFCRRRRFSTPPSSASVLNGSQSDKGIQKTPLEKRQNVVTDLCGGVSVEHLWRCLNKHAF